MGLGNLSNKRLIKMFALKFAFYPEKFFSGTSFQGPVGDFCLLSQVLCALDRRNHSFHSEEGSQVSCVGGYDDQSEEPPDATNNAARERPGPERRVKQGECEGQKGAARSCRPIIHLGIYPKSRSPTSSGEAKCLSQFLMYFSRC